MSKNRISVSSLKNVEHEGWITKQGGGIKSWHKRWLVLSGNNLYYFKTKKDQDVTGIIALQGQSSVKRFDGNKKSKNTLSISNTKDDKGRVYLVYPETEQEMSDWIKAIEKSIKKINGGSSTTTTTNTNGAGSSYATNNNNNTNTNTNNGKNNYQVGAGQQEQEHQSSDDHLEGVRAKLDIAKKGIDWLLSEDNRIIEFWQIWVESIPQRVEIIDDGVIAFEVSASADMSKLSWRSFGPQNIFIQKMVDFFWSVGAPETEIDKLNDVGALINPSQIGSWIDMSSKGGMDGGWFFPVEVPYKLAIEACDAGDAAQRVSDWMENNGVQSCCCVGRDMGAAPPRQTEIRFFIPGATLSEQLNKALSAYPEFGFPDLPSEAVTIIQKMGVSGSLLMSVITSSEGFVRLGLLVPNPPSSSMGELCSIGSGAGSWEKLQNFQKLIAPEGPRYVEFQYLVEGFGYGVYNEGFDVVFHFKAGEESKTA